ncbi:TonB-dependent receptor [Phenylobacterium sp.]|uniref:TonB-dependent receptor n=1 Tax=Phenylobacterium sp. TaxID=1871053 RepID=UPI002733BF83|nr:TonB-dependent receptor [Phenylobacterium sp.]MDP3853728.1 TonB-dependent receptor [Phenylobacterium sp.]
MSNTLHLRRLLIVGVSAMAIGAVASPAWSQNVIEELVVTAQKREEALQDVPIAVSAFNQDALEKAKIDGGPNLVLAVPNVNFSKGNFTGYNFQIRGIGSKLVAGSGDAGTGIHLNNAPLISNNLFETEFYDVERVEVLRGPQGTLYGRNATGGVVNLITAKPTDDFQALIRGEIGNYATRKVRGMINVPLGDTFALRLAGSYLKRDGFGKNLVTGNDADDRDLWGGRATLAFTPTDNFRAYLMLDHFDEEDNRSRIGKQFCTKDLGPANVGGVGYSANPVVAQIQRGFFSQGCQATSLYSPGVLGTVNSQSTLGGLFGVLGGFQTGDAYAGKMQTSDVRDIESTFDPIYQSKTDIYMFNVDWDVTEELKLTWLAAFTKFDLYTRQDYNRYVPSTSFNTTPNPVNAFAAALAAVPGGYGGIYGALFPGGVVNDPQNGAFNRFTTSDISSAYTEQWSHEVRLQSDYDGPFNFNVGGIMVRYQATGDYYVMFNTGTGFYQINNLLNTGNANCNGPSPCVSVDPGKEPNRSGHNYYDAYGPYDLRSHAFFGEVYYQMTDNFKLTAGLRYTKDDKEVENHQVTLGTPGTGIGAPLPGTPAILKVEFKETTGRIGFDWKPDLGFTDETLIYGFFARGYKAGGLNSPCSGGAGVICGPPTFEPEFIKSIEFGAKNTLLDGTMTLNLTFFNYDYEGYQVSKIVNRASTNENIDAKNRGLEFESVWQPLEGLRLNAAIGWLDTEIQSGTSVDTFNRTQGNPALIVVKSGAASNCVVSLASAQAALGLSNAIGTPLSLVLDLGIPGLPSSLCSGGYGPASDGVAVNLEGKELPNAPHWTVSLGAQYDWEFGNGWNVTVRGDYYKQTETFARIYNSAPDRIDDWQNVNLTLTVSNPGNGWELGAFVKNATDEEAITDFYLTDDSSGLFRNAFYTEPRTYGVSLQKRF